LEGWGKIKSAARYAGVCERTLREWLKLGLKYSKLRSGMILIRYGDIDQFLESFLHEDNRVEKLVEEVCREIRL